ncbi:MAG: sigma-70 family RNA polymerase sigma factor, partial [Sediminibacterium sp.]
EAFDNLFRRYYAMLIQYGSKICTDKNIVEDAIQDLFIELWQSKAGTQVQSVKAYFLKALKYKLLKQLKKQSLQSVDDSTDSNFQLSHDHFIIDREEESSTVKKIVQAINQLPARQKEIIYLKIYQALDYDEISEVMGINYQAARNLFYQSVKSLRQIITS